ncbi:MAG: Hsp20/alpha crystallin family protein [Ilumatobacteraceae bacterium]
MLVRTRPFNPAFDRRFDRAFDQLASSFVSGTTRRGPVVDAAWKDGSLVLTVDLPGTPSDAVGVAVAGRTLTLSATTPQLAWERSVRLGAALDAEQVSASYVDGRLTVTVGAVAAAEPRPIEISTTPAPAIQVEATADESVESVDQPENGTSDNA